MRRSVEVDGPPGHAPLSLRRRYDGWSTNPRDIHDESSSFKFKFKKRHIRYRQTTDEIPTKFQ